jgi:cytochrome c-type biogenesis protein
MAEWFLAFVLGNAAILSNACLLPLYPGLLAFLAGNTQGENSRRVSVLLGALVLAGILSTMTFIGFLLALFQASFGDLLPILLPLIYGLVILLGILMFVGRNPFAQLQTLDSPLFKNAYLTAYVYGILFAPMTLPCTGPIILSAFTVGSGIGDIANGLSYFFFFGLGFGWPLLVLPLATLALQRRFVRWLGKQHETLNRSGGILLIAVGIFGILTELTPQIWTNFYLDQSQQFFYWLLVFIIIGLSAYVLRPKTPSKV